MVAEYGTEQAPPPWQIFTIPNNIQEGNLHFVQKVFEGAFEVIFPELYPKSKCANHAQQFDILYSSASAPKSVTCKKPTPHLRLPLTGSSEKPFRCH